jgi:hypothetical protein
MNLPVFYAASHGSFNMDGQLCVEHKFDPTLNLSPTKVSVKSPGTA